MLSYENSCQKLFFTILFSFYFKWHRCYMPKILLDDLFYLLPLFIVLLLLDVP